MDKAKPCQDLASRIIIWNTWLGAGVRERIYFYHRDAEDTEFSQSFFLPHSHRENIAFISSELSKLLFSILSSPKEYDSGAV
ncbi:hypothetical protein [Algoriphagus marinus]|uniref:hypothetical protein n=1 Tax=Algoriphagus marinus TaxID=1925762 RepID=UPI0011154817|nr:hypothetical protein [Algoriphagus marinus]